MPDHITPVLAAALAVELGLFFAGLVVWWRAALSPAARARPPRLAPWPVSPSDFFACALIVVGGGFFSLLVVHVAGRPFLPKSPAADTNALVYGTALQLGLLAGVAGARVLLQGRFDSSGGLPSRPVSPPLPLASLLAFVAVMTAVDLTSMAWGEAIRFLGLPSEPQDLVDMFAHPQSRATFVMLFLLATVVAPVVEELIFRAGLFRYLRTRIPRWAALLLPALFFAALHGNWASFGPIAVLAVVFSLAYERTGRISTTIIAHGLFNLNSILLVMAGMRT